MGLISSHSSTNTLKEADDGHEYYKSGGIRNGLK